MAEGQSRSSAHQIDRQISRSEFDRQLTSSPDHQIRQPSPPLSVGNNPASPECSAAPSPLLVAWSSCSMPGCSASSYGKASLPSRGWCCAGPLPPGSWSRSSASSEAARRWSGAGRRCASGCLRRCCTGRSWAAVSDQSGGAGAARDHYGGPADCCRLNHRGPGARAARHADWRSNPRPVRDAPARAGAAVCAFQTRPIFPFCTTPAHRSCPFFMRW